MPDQPGPNTFPLAYLITVRTYGTWLHGDARLSVDRHGVNLFGQPRRSANSNLAEIMRMNMPAECVLLDDGQRAIVTQAIEEVCAHRQYGLSAVNVRSNHFHVVVSAQCRPELIADAFKSYATRKLRRSRLIGDDVQPWARGRSRRYLWKPRHVLRAIDYVLYGQGDIPAFDD